MTPVPNIYNMLHEGNLVDALSLLKGKIKSINDWDMSQQLDRICTTHRNMLKYVVQGIEDPGYSRMRTELMQQAYALNDSANRKIRLTKKPEDIYCRIQAECSKAGIDMEGCLSRLALATDGKTIDELTVRLFNLVWTSSLWSKADQDMVETYFTGEENKQLPKLALCVTVSAVTLALFEMFDINKFTFLFNAYIHPDINVSQRALTGIILAMRRYDIRLDCFSEIRTRFSMLADNSQFIHEAYTILMQLQYSKLTDDVNRKMRDDIMPAIMKGSHMLNTNNIDLQALKDSMTENGENPDWIDGKLSKKMDKKMQEMISMQTEGADIYMSSFCHLKSHPFFSPLAHWLFPFSRDILGTVATSTGKDRNSFFQSFATTLPFCDSDKYSFIFMVDTLGTADTADSIREQLKDQLGEDGIQELGNLSDKAETSTSHISRNYIFDLYRVFHSYPYRSQFFNPFSKALDGFSPLSTNSLSPLLSHREELLSLAEFMMRKGIYADSEQLFRFTQPHETEEDADIWQKIGFCEQKQHKPHALNTYLLADTLCPNSKWTIQHIAQTAIDLHNYDIATEYLDRLISDSGQDEENANPSKAQLKLFHDKAQCLFAQKKYQEALPLLYRLTYFNEESAEYQEMLAWGLLMTGSYDKAENIYRQLNDAINTGHCLMAKGQIMQAYEQYASAYQDSLKTSDEEHFHKRFWEHASQITSLGITRDRLEQIYDAVRCRALDP